MFVYPAIYRVVGGIDGDFANLWIFYADILLPWVNYLSLSTVHFFTCKVPDYQQSLWKMISTVSFCFPRLICLGLCSRLHIVEIKAFTLLYS